MSILYEAIVIHGADGSVFANPAAARMLGYETSQDAVAASAASIRDRDTIRDEEGRDVGPEAFAGRRALRGEPTEPQTLRGDQRCDRSRELWTRNQARVIEGSAARSSTR